MAIILAACGFAWERGRRQGKAWHQFGLGTFLIALTACSIACASVIQSTKSRQREAAALAPWGGSHDDRGMRVEMRPTALTWLRELVGDNYLQDWDRVVHFGCAIDAESIKTCQELDCLKVLHVYSDVDPEILSKVSPNLEQLEIHHPINLSPLSRFKSLKILRIQGNFKQSELPLTAELSRLEVLAISGRWMTDDQVAAIAQLPSLKKLWLTRTNISDASIEQLAKLTSLRKLHLYETHMTSRGIEGLRAALPGTAISLGDEKK
jgi:hypothetical protein